MTTQELSADTQLLQNYISRLVIAEDKQETDKLMKMCKAKLKEVYNDKIKLLKEGQ